MIDNELGPEFTELLDRLQRMETKSVHAYWGDAYSTTVEDRARQINSALDQIENGTATIVTDEELKDL